MLIKDPVQQKRICFCREYSEKKIKGLTFLSYKGIILLRQIFELGETEMDTNSNTAPESAIQPKTKLNGKVVKTTLAGAILDVGQNLPGVIHISQLKAEPVNRVEDVLKVGQSVDVWVRRVKDDRIELTMIEPMGLEWREIKPEMVVKGTVARLESYGAFIEIGAERPGLVHVSEITHGFVKSPNEILHEGDEVEAMVLEVNRRKKQIRLSIKATLPKPEETPAEAKAEPRKASGRKPRIAKNAEEAVSEPSVPDPTVFEIAWQQALERAENKKGQKAKRVKNADKDQEDLLSRTLETRLPTG
jgi:small subunit ribosomal protein S1